MMDWHALEDGSRLEGDVPGSQKQHDGPAGDDHRSHGKDTLVEEDDGEFDHREAGIPEKLHHIKILLIQAN